MAKAAASFSFMRYYTEPSEEWTRYYGVTFWGPIDPWLTDKIYMHEGFREYFLEHAKRKNQNGFYPTVTVRQLMWAIRMKPMKKERWETVFDRKEV